MAKYCIMFSDATSNSGKLWEQVTGIYGDEIETNCDPVYDMTKDEAEETLKTYQQIADERGWDWACFFIDELEEI